MFDYARDREGMTLLDERLTDSYGEVKVEDPLRRPFLRGDANSDGDVDGNDFLVWQAHFGISVGGGSASAAAVPEPSTIILSLVGLAFFGAYVGFRRRQNAH